MVKTSQTVINNILISYSEVFATNFEPGFGNPRLNPHPKNAIIWLHGWRSNSQNWLPVIEQVCDALSEAGSQEYQNIAIDFPGFGNSPMPKNIINQPWKLEDYGQVILDFITNQGYSKVILVGHSFGGRISMLLASDFGQKVLSNKLQKIILVGSHGFKDDSQSNSLKKTIAKLVKPIFKIPILEPIKNIIYKSIGSEDYHAIPQLQRTFVNIVNRDLSSEIGQIRVPIDMIWGADDQATPVEFAYRIKTLATLATSEINIIEKAGHYVFLDRTSEFVEVLVKYVSDNAILYKKNH